MRKAEMRGFRSFFPILCLSISLAAPAVRAQEDDRIIFTDPKGKDGKALTEEDLRPRKHAGGLDFMIGTDGFGIGFFYNRSLTGVLTAFANLSLSEVHDSRLREYFDYFGTAHSINKVNRIYRVPFHIGLQYRLFKDDIVENFRPFVNCGAGPVLLYIAPARDAQDNEKELFSSIGEGHPEYTFGAFAGFGAQFGFDRGSVFGLNIRYYIVPVPSGIRSVDQGELDNANGFYIALTLGIAF
jgi:hypothetical protein